MSERFAAIERILDVAPHYAGISEDEFKAARAELEAARKAMAALKRFKELRDMPGMETTPEWHLAFKNTWAEMEAAIAACQKPASGRQE